MKLLSNLLRGCGRIVPATVLAAVLLVGCNESVTGPGDPEDIEARLFKAMNEDDYAAAGDIVYEFYAMRDHDPLTYRNTFLLGAAAMWWVAETSHPGANGLQITSQAIPIVLESFVDVIQNDAVNRAGASALLGAFLYDLGLDRTQGGILIEQAVAARPEVGLFQRMHTRRMSFADDSITGFAVDAGFDFWDFCAGTPINRDNPDYTSYVRQPTDDEHQRFCWGSERVPHGYEGAWLIFGDLLVKRGQIEEARRAYMNAKLGPNYSRWKYRSEVESRLVSDLDARHATYSSRYQEHWAPIGVPAFACTQCHASAQ